MIKDSIIPSNYFITKSMEFTKESKSGTLWYLKKFLTLYNGIFLSNDIETELGINKIIKIFDSFIDSLPEEVKTDAKDFFYPEEVDIRKCKRFADFKGIKHFLDIDEGKKYEHTCKKYYFVYLMAIGGQAGVKKCIREHLYSEDFCMVNLEDIINEYKDNNPDEERDNIEIINDYHAALRNERQILWYYGFVHSKSSGANELEFSSLTPIGEAALDSNYDEFRIIWEHQKIKMISQTVKSEFQSLKGNEYASKEKFYINYSPYFTILRFLKKANNISKDEYQYIISRTNHINVDDTLAQYDLEKNEIEKVKSKVKLFNRPSETKPEDFDKEIKKYIYGLRSDLSKDHKQNDFGVCKFEAGITLTDIEKFNKIYEVYSIIDEYKIQQYKELFNSNEFELKIKYGSKLQDIAYSPNSRVKLDWDLYNMHIDNKILLSIMLLRYCILKNCELKDIKLEEIKEIKNYYSELLQHTQIKKKELNDSFIKIRDGLINEDLISVVLDEEDVIVEDYFEETDRALQHKIEELSKTQSLSSEHIRNGNLINLIKILYNKKYTNSEKLITCECCGNTTFLTYKDEAYLEFHHILPFNIVDGPDHYINICGICPDCHRKMHYAKEEMKADLYRKFDINNHYNKTLVERFKELYNEKILKSYHLEFALVDKIISEEEYNEILA